MNNVMHAYLADETFMLFSLFSELNGLFGQDSLGFNGLFG